MTISKHHVIPICMQGEHIERNIIETTPALHTELHNTQNVAYGVCRKFREKTNGILIPNNFYFDEKENLLQRYFEKAKIEVPKQKLSLISQVNRYNINNPDNQTELLNNNIDLQLDYLVSQYIEAQKQYTYHVLRSGKGNDFKR